MENIINNIKFWVGLASLIIVIIQNVILMIKYIKNKKWNELKTCLKNKILPLMEQAEVAFKDSTERQSWVIKKLGEELHIDFYKYKKVLMLVIDIITEICEQTHNMVNSTKIVNIVKKEDNGDNGDTTLY